MRRTSVASPLNPFQVESALLNNGLLKAPTCSPLYEEKPQVRILSKKSSRVSAPASTPLVGWCHNNKNACNFQEEGACNQCLLAEPNKSPGQENSIKPAWELRKAYQATDATQQGPFYSTLANIEGRILVVAKDQHGCRFLQRKFDEEALGGLHRQSEIKLATVHYKQRGLVNVSLNMHDTRALQKLIETLKSHQHVAIVTASLRSGVVTLIKDLNGNHVIQRCLQHLNNEDNQVLLLPPPSPHNLYCFVVLLYVTELCVCWMVMYNSFLRLLLTIVSKSPPIAMVVVCCKDV
ncbi:hypothetical protein GOP47_0020839 [Adiantum capillus-veneris]|uniref:Uncharacterized protein n=1 Tax=Adiantum capillus-veneris TaxID=13818 RepID=A0A9D4UBI4_ADICA|nr:hypothetical protein GOP47_0020839 [Adiantum capillus-veneris]